MSFFPEVELNDQLTLSNLLKPSATSTVIDGFKQAINAVKDQEYTSPKKSLFKRITGDSNLELIFTLFLEGCPDVSAYVKNYQQNRVAHFKLDYVNHEGRIADYFPDFLVRLNDGRVVVVETKGRVDANVPLKMRRLAQWCEDVNNLTPGETYGFVYVDQEGFEAFRRNRETFQRLIEVFREYQDRNSG